MITQWLRALLSKRFAASIARHVMTTIVGWLTFLHLPTEVMNSFAEAGTAVTTALIIAGIAAFWSWMDKAKD